MSRQLISPKISFPPGPSGIKSLNSAFRQLGENALSNYVDLWHTYGDIIFTKWGPLRSYMLANPEDIHHVLVKNHKNYEKGIAYDGFRLVVGQGLVTSDGDLWRTQRRLMQPPFTATAVQSFVAMMVEVTEQMMARWEKFAGTGQPVHMDDEMMRLTTGVIGRAIFNIDLSTDLIEVGYAFQDAFAFVPARSMNPLSLSLAIPLPKHRRFKKSMAIIEDFVAERIAEKRGQPMDGSLLSQLLHAKDKDSGQGMSEAQLRDEVVTLFFAGFETTARSLTWLFYLLSRHETIAEQVAVEAKALLNGRSPEISDLFQLTYTRQVVDEVLRLYPPVAVMPRQNIEDDTIGGYHVPAGSLILSMTYLAHRHPDYWQNSDQFLPDRFAPELADKRPKYAYIPFANGPRICLGNNFALQEMVVACAMAGSRFKFCPVSKEEIPAKFLGVTIPAHPIKLYIESR